MSGVQVVDVRSEGEYHLLRAVEIAMISHRGPPSAGGRMKPETVSHWKADAHGLWFGWHEKLGGVPLPVPLEAAGVVPIITGWLALAEYGDGPDTDGDSMKGWRLRAGYGAFEISNPFYATFCVSPEWMIYGK